MAEEYTPGTKKFPTNNKSNLSLFQDQTVAIYTALRIIMKMKKEMGLEATLEYLESYLSEIEKLNLSLRGVTDEVLEVIDIQKIFRELMG